MRSVFSGAKLVSVGFVCLFTLFVCVSPAFSQSASTGALTGTVTDPSGAVISGATVTATNPATGQARSVTTDTSGVYRISLLPPGNYSIRFSATGFKTVEVPSVTINVTETQTVNHALEVGAQTQQITVESNVETIQTQNATVGGLVSSDTVTSLPLSTRNYTQVIDLSPGVVANVATATAVGNGTQDINVNGSGSDQNTYMMDGAIITNYGSGGAAQSGSYAGISIPNPDSLQEFKVQTSQYDASYGQNPGANVNVVTKSGTNQFHGSVWEFNRNNFFNANDFFFKNSEKSEGLPNKPPEVKQNQFGFTLGGPIIKDKLLFFGSYQGTRQLNGIGSNGFATGITQVALLPFNEPGQPFASARGDNAGTVPLGLDPNGAACNYNTYKGYLGCAFAGQFGLTTGTFVNPPDQGTLSDANTNISNTFVNLLRQTENIPQVKGGFNNGYYVPSVRYNANALDGTPIPACKVQESAGNIFACSAPTTISQATQADEDQFMINADYVLSPKHTISEKYFFSKDPQIQSFSCLGGCYPGAPEDAHYGSQSLVTKLTSVLTNNFVNEAFFSFQRLYLDVSDGVTVNSCDVNIVPAINNGQPCGPNSPVANTNEREYKLIPVIGNFGAAVPFVGTDWGAFQLGGNFFSATHSIQNNFIGDEKISWNHGKHSFRAGFNVQRIQWNWNQPDRQRGWINSLNVIDLMTSSSVVPNDGTPFVGGGIFLNVTNRLLPSNVHHWRINDFSSFAQDDIKVNRKLTLNLGLRWEYDGWPTEKDGIFTNFAAQPAALINTGSFFLGQQASNPSCGNGTNFGAAGCVANQIGTLAGYIIQSNYNKAAYGNLTAASGATGITVNSNKTLLYGSPLDNFSPRIGLAWQAMDKLVVRAGYGMFFDRVYGNLVGDNILGNEPPQATQVGNDPGQTLQNPFCSPITNSCPQTLGFIPRTLAVAKGDSANGATVITDINGGDGTGLITSGDGPGMRTPKVQQYNLDLQYEFGHGWVADVGYVGTHGIHLYDWNRAPNLAYLVDCGPASATCNPPTDEVNINLERPASSFPFNDAANTNPNTQVLRNTPRNVLGRASFLGVAPSGLQQVQTDGDHLYNALQAQVRHQFSHGLFIQASYTWSKLITNINASESGGGIATPGNVLSGSASSNDPANLRQQYGLAAFNRAHRFLLSYSYELPYKGEGWHEKVLGGWGVSGVTTIQTGTPFTVVQGNSATLLYNSIPFGAYNRAELADPVNCNSLGNCKSGTALGTPGGIKSRLGGSFGGPGFINQNAFTDLPMFGGIPSGNAGPFTGNCTGANPEFVDCGTGFGNSAVGIMSCCTQHNWDFAIIKNTTVGGLREDASLQFRAEFFNLWNHAQFNPPVNDRNSGIFGAITSSSVPGRILQFGLKYTF
jgi:outer membrane receptor protein involved in Fe transport